MFPRVPLTLSQMLHLSISNFQNSASASLQQAQTSKSLPVKAQHLFYPQSCSLGGLASPPILFLFLVDVTMMFIQIQKALASYSQFLPGHLLFLFTRALCNVNSSKAVVPFS